MKLHVSMHFNVNYDYILKGQNVSDIQFCSFDKSFQ